MQDLHCKHGNTFSQTNIIKDSNFFTVYNEDGETQHDIPVFGRLSIGNCKCIQQYDAHSLMLYHVGSGQMVDYVTLNKYIFSMCNSGTTVKSFHKTIHDNCM